MQGLLAPPQVFRGCLLNASCDPQHPACGSRKCSELQHALAAFQISAALALIHRLPHGRLQCMP
ncbi:hypothetical protein DZD52_16540 [Xanthomonas nasturtii]|uniref:Uncharacterized protein n=1 Tax=Xanthomonas nasturtii TaxID=1843581 RepID=A0A3E1KGB5_9XANT|nr:hypothetical protein DZD52_16540 [Xanthomonas nasturtii]